MQMQVKRNAEDLQNYLKDLDSWEDGIKKKDEGLSRRKPILKEVGHMKMHYLAMQELVYS